MVLPAHYNTASLNPCLVSSSMAKWWAICLQPLIIFMNQYIFERSNGSSPTTQMRLAASRPPLCAQPQELTGHLCCPILLATFIGIRTHEVLTIFELYIGRTWNSQLILIIWRFSTYSSSCKHETGCPLLRWAVVCSWSSELPLSPCTDSAKCAYLNLIASKSSTNTHPWHGYISVVVFGTLSGLWKFRMKERFIATRCNYNQNILLLCNSINKCQAIAMIWDKPSFNHKFVCSRTVYSIHQGCYQSQSFQLVASIDTSSSPLTQL